MNHPDKLPGVRLVTDYPSGPANGGPNEAERENAQLWKALRLAKAQRDRAIWKVRQLQPEGPVWHPDNEGHYALDVGDDGL